VSRKIKEEIKEIAATGTAPLPTPIDASAAVKHATIKDGKAEFEKPSV
jgi:hypothetical protein